MQLQTIEELTNTYSARRRQLEALVIALQRAIEDEKRQRLPDIRDMVKVTVAARDELQAAIANNRGLFRSPKSRTFAGIKVGYQKQRGKVIVNDDAAVIKRIRKLLPEDQAELLIIVTEKVDKNAVGGLAVDDLKRLGIGITDDTDIVIIKPVDGEIDKLVNALVDDTDTVEDAAA